MTTSSVTLISGAEAHVYSFAAPPAGSGAPVRPAARFPVADGASNCIASPARDRVAYTTASKELVYAGPDGTALWRHSLEAEEGRPERRLSGRASYAVSPDGRTLWLYVQGPLVPVPRGASPETDRMPARNPHLVQGTDRLLCLDTSDGAVLAEAELGTSGHGAVLRPHPDGEHALVGVGEGQDGGRNFRARLTDDGLELHEYGTYGFLGDLSPNGRVFSVSDESEVTLHAFPDGETLTTFGLDAFDCDEDGFETLFLGTHLADFLDDDRLVVSVNGEHVPPEDDGPYDVDFHENHVVAVADGRVLGPLPGASRHEALLIVLGDGSWLSVDGPGRLHRHTL